MAGEHTGGSSGGTTATGTATGTRALDVAMASMTAFVPQAGAMVMRASERHVDRMVPENDATRRSRPLALLGFSDRVLGPYVRHAQQSPLRMFGGAEAPAEAEGSRDFEIEPTSWVFPRPWYIDELAWLQSVRMSVSAESGAARPTGLPGASARGAGAGGLSAFARGAAAPPAVALDLVAPSFGRAGLSDTLQRGALASTTMAAATISSPAFGRTVAGQPARMARPTALRAWSPLVPFSAVQAAELMAGVLAPAGRTGGPGEDAPWQEAPARELVAPFASRELVAPKADSTAQAAQISGRAANQPSRPGSSGASDVPEALRNRLQNALRRLEIQRAQSRAAAPTPGQPAAASAAARPPGASGTSATAVAAAAASAPVNAAASEPAVTTGPAVTAAAPAPVGTGVPARERALELMLHSALAGRSGQDMAPVTGPRLALPAGLGGLIAGLRAARTVARPVPSRPNAVPVATAATEMRSPVALASATGEPDAAFRVAGGQARAAELPLIGGAPGALGFGQTAEIAARAPGAGYGSAYRAVTRTLPAALAHIAWSDRWLARFAGASTQALAVLEATTSAAANTPASRAFSGQVPEPVFLSASPGEREPRAASAAAGALTSAAWRGDHASSAAGRTAAGTAPVAQPSAAPAMQAAAAGPRTVAAAPRIADDATVSDEMFAAIAAAAARAPRRTAQPTRGGDADVASRGQPARGKDAGIARPDQPRAASAAAGQAAVGASQTQPSASGPDLAQLTGSPVNHVDRLLAASPAAPGPGMRVALASSPVAPALSALVPLPASPSFDVRAMHGVELASAYLAGVIEPGGVGTAARAWPMLWPRRWEQGAAAPMQLEPSPAGPGLWTDLPMVAPAAASAAPGASADAGRASAAQRLTPGAASAAGAPGAVTRGSSAAAGASTEARRVVLAADRARPVAGPGPLLPAALPVSAGASYSPGTAQAATDRAVARHASREATGTGPAMTAAVAPAFAAFAYGPGSAAAQAESWAMMREQHAADLSLDYVSPELLVAAQAYGFGPAEAAQAARLSSSGRTGLAALAAAVDLRFIDAFAAARSGEWPAANLSSISLPTGVRSSSSTKAISTHASGAAPDAASRSVPGSAATGPAVSAPATSTSIAASAPARAQDSAVPAAPAVAITAPGGPAATAVPGAAAMPVASMRSLGMPVRTPRGAFLWPHATTMAMNLQLSDADTAQPLSLAALDLLAANAVAQMGALVAPWQAPAAAIQQGVVTSADARPAASAGTSPAAAGAGQGQSSLATALRAGLASATPLAPEVLGAIMQRDSVLAAGAPLATYVTPVLDFDSGLGLDSGRAAATTSSAAGARAAGPRTAFPGPGAVSDSPVQENTADTPAVAAAALGHRSPLPAGFEALYVALARSPAGRSLSPAVRAARALALAGSYVAPAGTSRAGASPVGPGVRARAAAAWAVMPTVFTGGADAFLPSAAGSDAFAGASAPDMPTLAGVDQPGAEQPERRLMAARAGESLQSFVAPGEVPLPAGNRAASGPASSTSTSSAAASRSRGAVQRVPTAAQPLVQTAPSRANVAAVQEMIRSAQQKRASGDNSIPAWFEEAARRMFQDGPDGGGISLAEMTLVTAAPARLVAASPKSASAGPASPPANVTNGSESHDAEPTANVEQIARDVYAEISRMIEFARNRNGDTWR